MKNISDSDLQIILELSVNIGMNYLMWTGLHGELTTKQIRGEYDCCDELLKVLDSFDTDGSKKLDSKRLVMMTFEHLNKNYSQNHAKLYRIGFSVVQQTVGLSARLSSSHEADSGKSISDLLPEHMKNLKDRLKGMLPPDIITDVIDLVTNKIGEAGLELDISDLLVQVFNKVAFPEKERTVTVALGEEEKTYKTFTEMIGGLLNYSVEKFTKKCTSVDDFNNEKKFRETIEIIAADFLNKNKNTLNMHKSDFLEELNQDRQAETERPSLAVEELVLGAIGGMADGFWLKHQQNHGSTN
ncbi:MAG: hypothetical protein ACUZ8N_08075 [Candidatus Scalindua sp.]